MSASNRVACALPARELAGRRERWLRLIDASLVETAAIPSGVRLGFRSSDAAERELRELVALERECCSFAVWFVARRGRRLSLVVTAKGDGVAAVRALFEVPTAGGTR